MIDIMSFRPVEDEIVSRESKEQLWSAFNCLSIKQKIAVGDYYLESKKLHEIGSQLEISKEGVRNHRIRGVKKIGVVLRNKAILKSDF